MPPKSRRQATRAHRRHRQQSVDRTQPPNPECPPYVLINASLEEIVAGLDTTTNDDDEVQPDGESGDLSPGHSSLSTPAPPMAKKFRFDGGGHVPRRKHPRGAHADLSPEQDAAGTPHLKSSSLKHLKNATPLVVDYDGSIGSGGGYTGPPDNTAKARAADHVNPMDLDEARALGFKIIEWDGCKPLPITDKDGKMLVYCAGRPLDKHVPPHRNSYADCLKALNEDIRKLTESTLAHAPSGRPNRRGAHQSVSLGVSYGGGQRMPGNIQAPRHIRDAADALMETEGISRIVGFQMNALKLSDPALYQYNANTLDTLFSTPGHGHLQRTFPDTVMGAFTINFGTKEHPAVDTKWHTDFKNLRGGKCILTTGGDGDPDAGGHLLVWELKLCIRFPPGATIILPSAIFGHSTIPVPGGKLRWSFTQYTAAGIYRYVENGCCTDRAIVESAARILGPDASPFEHLQLKKAKEDLKDMLERKRTIWAKTSAMWGVLDL